MTHQTSKLSGSSAKICREMGWPAGTVIRDAGGTEVVRITAVGEEMVLAKQVSYRKIRIENGPEFLFDLSCRDWVRG